MARPPRQLPEDILDIASALFAARGFDGVSFRDLTEATGAKRSLLLYHFESKEELWRRAMLRIMARLDASMASRSLPPPDSPDEERVPAVMRAFIDTLIDVPEYGQVLLREGVTPGPRLDWIIRYFMPAFATGFVLADQAAEERMRETMLRDLVISAPLAATALGPLLEASMASATRSASVGIHPMSAARRDELVALLTSLILGKQPATVAA